MSETRLRYNVSSDITLFCCLICLNKEKFSKEEKAQIEFEEWVENLERTHSEEEVLQILKEKVNELENR